MHIYAHKSIPSMKSSVLSLTVVVFKVHSEQIQEGKLEGENWWCVIFLKSWISKS